MTAATAANSPAARPIPPPPFIRLGSRFSYLPTLCLQAYFGTEARPAILTLFDHRNAQGNILRTILAAKRSAALIESARSAGASGQQLLPTRQAPQCQPDHAARGANPPAKPNTLA